MKQGTSHFNFRDDSHKFDIYIDLEFTGFDPIKNEVIELGAVVCERGKFDILDSFVKRMKPAIMSDNMWDEGAEKVHGISREVLLGEADQRDVLIEFLRFLVPFRNQDNKPQLFVSHANRMKTSTIDYRFLEWAYRKNDLEYSFWKVFKEDYVLSTISMALDCGYGKKQLFDDNGNPVYTKTGRPKLEGNGLAIWSKRAEFELEHHTAISDAIGCMKVREFLTNNHGLQK